MYFSTSSAISPWVCLRASACADTEDSDEEEKEGKPGAQTHVVSDAKLKAWDAQASMQPLTPSEEDTDEVETHHILTPLYLIALPMSMCNNSYCMMSAHVDCEREE